MACDLHLTDEAAAPAAVAIARQLLDLDADPTVIDAHLAADALLAPLVAAGPGRRIPGTPDGAELAVRAVLGQQVSTAAARTHTARIVRAVGTPLPWTDGTLTHLFPTPDAIAGLPDSVLALPARRRTTVRAVAAALAGGALRLDAGADPAAAVAALLAVPGIGPWTAGTVAMRALGDADAFLPTDLGVAAAGVRLGLLTRRALVAHAEAWRPWRAYAMQYLWGTLDHAINTLPP